MKKKILNKISRTVYIVLLFVASSISTYSQQSVVAKDWLKAQKEHTIQGYKHFATKHPNSTYTQSIDSLLQTMSWKKNFIVKRSEIAYSIAVTPTDNYLMAGRIQSKGTDNFDAWVVKLDSNGNVLWEKTFGGKDYDVAQNITVTPTGEYLIVGTTQSKGAGGFDAWVIKLDKNGEKIWDKAFGGKKKDEVYSIKVTPKGEYIVVGYTYSKGAGYSDVWVIKLNKNGRKIWDKTYGGEKVDFAYSAVVTPDNEYLVAGRTHSQGLGYSDIWVIKLDKNGKKIWDRTYGGRRADRAYDITMTHKGEYIVVGDTNSQGEARRNAWVVKIDKKGEKIWDKVLGDGAYSTIRSVLMLPTEECIIAGHIYPRGTGQADAWIAKLDKNGNKLWDKTFGGAARDRASSIIATPTGEYLMIGRTESKKPNENTLWLMKLDKNGDLYTPENE